MGEGNFAVGTPSDYMRSYEESIRASRPDTVQAAGALLSGETAPDPWKRALQILPVSQSR